MEDYPRTWAEFETRFSTEEACRDYLLVITGAIFVVVTGLLMYAVVRFRRRDNDDGTEPAQIYGSGPVEAVWAERARCGRTSRRLAERR